MQDGGMAHPVMLSGPRVTLRAPTIDDAEQLFERITSDPEVSRYLAWRPHPDIAETRRVITDVFNTAGEVTWLIDLRGGRPIGACGWHHPKPHIIEFGYYLGRPWWGHGFMSEAVSLLIEEAQRNPAAYRMSAHCHVDNTASARLLQRSGLTLEGRLARYAVLPNLSEEPQDCLLFAKALR